MHRSALHDQGTPNSELLIRFAEPFGIDFFDCFAVLHCFANPLSFSILHSPFSIFHSQFSITFAA